ncbi:hypothetical protein N0V95_005828 [Ascochyta clinopodiicola]|nr:hypothetical protein N0V95_005828 [Ascochyta clinopodiicola]
MPVNTLSVGAAVTPTVIETYILHYLNRSPLRQKPTAHISYHEGLELIRRFLHYASLHPVDELQAFTSQWVPVPHWVHVNKVEIPNGQLQRSAQYINAQLGPKGVEAVGGQTWWQWRRENTKLEAEWIEMKKDRDAREKSSMPKGQRIMLYVHGGAYFFGSVDEHRYQMQRHARKLQARILAPKYRLAPQFPFPCGLMDCLAAYLYLLEQGHDPNTIVLAGDSAGGGMVLSMLVTLRDQGVPLPAGAILISPWVDLTHSFPSLSGDDKMDYIPAHGFVHKPSISWPPPNADDLLQLEKSTSSANQKDKSTPRVSLSGKHKEERAAQKEAKAERVRGYSVNTEKPDINAILGSTEAPDTWISPDGKYGIGPKGVLSVQLDEVRVEIKDQIQLYTANHLLTHPLVSPALQPSLGGLPPLLIQTGGGELLRDEQIYLAHKAAHPGAYLPPPSNMQTAEEIEAQASKYKPTNVQLQVWDDLCHVAPTLSFTRPAKHMYRSIAQFGAWALARAQKTSIDILDDDDISFVSTDSESSPDNTKQSKKDKESKTQTVPHFGTDGIIDKGNHEARVGKAGDLLPPFENHMIRQRIDRHGYIYPLAPKEDLVALNLPISEVGVPKPGPVSKWMKASQQWNGKFAKQKIKIQQQRMKEMKAGFERFEGETPPPTALAGRRIKGMKAEKAKKKSWGMALWSLWGSKHDEMTIDREQKADQTPPPPSKAVAADPEQATTSLDATTDSTTDRSRDAGLAPIRPTRMRSRSRHSNVTDQGQATSSQDDLQKLSQEFSRIAPPSSGLAEATVIAPERKHSGLPTLSNEPVQSPGIIISAEPTSPPTIVPETDGTSTRPSKGGIAYPFSLKVEGQSGHHANASMVTLQSVNIMTPPAVEESKQLGDTAALPTLEGESNATQPASGHFSTDAPGAGLFSGQWVSATPGVEQAETPALERPGVERFQTAYEDLSVLSDAGKKV